MNLDELKKLGDAKWRPIEKLINKFLKADVLTKEVAQERGTPELYPVKPILKPGLWKWVPVQGGVGEWVPSRPEDLPRLVSLDFEGKEVEPDHWLPVCCSIWGNETFYYWNASEGDEVMPFPPKRIVIGQNCGAYDRRYLSAEYEHENPGIIYLDTMQMANVIHGMGGDREKDSGDTIRQLWNTFDARAKENKPVPKWYEKVSPLGLDVLVKKYLGINLTKTVRDDWVKDPTSVQPETLFEYCMGDTTYTTRLAQILIKKVRGYITHPVSWIGFSRVSQSRYYLKDWTQFIQQNDEEVDAAVERLTKLQNKLIKHTTPENCPMTEDQWKVISRGPNKGKTRWETDIAKTNPMNSDLAVLILRLTWYGHPLEIRKQRGQPKWFANDQPLPHPKGKGNLGTPLCLDYAAFAKSGVLKSEVIPQKVLINLFNILKSIGQWTSYRGRYENVYRQPIADGLELSVADLNSCGTVTHRSTSNLWVVLPKPKEEKIGSGVMNNIVAPPGKVMVSADFVSQESRMACMLTDARQVKHKSCAWSEAVLSGDKALKTDSHNLTATNLLNIAKALDLHYEVDRQDAKVINFSLQYFSGLTGLAGTYQKITGCSKEEAEKIISRFMGKMKGTGGDAELVFNALQYVANCSNLRTYLLGIKQPDTLNPIYLPNDKQFWTARCNWLIQSGGVDEKHLLIFLIEHHAKQRGIDAQFMLEVHDRVAFSCYMEDSQDLADIYNMAMSDLIELAYEAAAKFWDQFHPRTNKRSILTPLDNWRSFETIDISESLMEVN